MLFHLKLLHLLLALSAAACVRLALREIAGRSMSPSRLAMLPLVAAGMAFVFFLFFLSLHWPPWLFGVALLVGFAAGAGRGLTMSLRFDHMWRLVRSSRHRVLLWVTLLLAGAVVLEIAGAAADPNAGLAAALVRLAAAEIAALCAGALAGHALAIAFHLSSTPHVTLRR
jgi:hypothetical protein